MQSIFYYAVFYPAVELVSALAAALIIWYGGGRVMADALTLGSLVAFLQYSQRFFRPISDMSEKFNVLQGAMASSERIFALLPEPQRARFLALWTEMHEGVTLEARFANAVDRAMPVLLNLANEGGSWREHGVSHAQVIGRVGPPVEAGCPALWAHLRERLDQAQRDGWFGTRST